MLKIIEEHFDHLGEKRTGKVLESLQLSSTVTAEDATQRLPELMEHIARAVKTEAAEAALPHLPEIVDLKIHAPAIYAILMTACEYSHVKSKREISKTALSRDVEERIKKAILKPGMYKAYAHAVNLANPLYTYNHSKSQLRQRKSVDENIIDETLRQKVAVPDKPLYALSYCNKDFRKVLYATCRFHGIGENKIPDLESLVTLLVDLGFPDADAEDYVSSFITLISGHPYKRESKHGYRHYRQDRNY